MLVVAFVCAVCLRLLFAPFACVEMLQISFHFWRRIVTSSNCLVSLRRRHFLNMSQTTERFVEFTSIFELTWCHSKFLIIFFFSLGSRIWFLSFNFLFYFFFSFKLVQGASSKDFCCPPVWEKRCFQNKSKSITEEYFSKHINIKTKLKHKLITEVINLIKLRSLGGETCWSY